MRKYFSLHSGHDIARALPVARDGLPGLYGVAQRPPRLRSTGGKAGRAGRAAQAACKHAAQPGYARAGEYV